MCLTKTASLDGVQGQAVSPQTRVITAQCFHLRFGSFLFGMRLGADWQRSCSLGNFAPRQRALLLSGVKHPPVYHPVRADSHSGKPEASLQTITGLFLREQRPVISEGCSQLSEQEPHLELFGQIQSIALRAHAPPLSLSLSLSFLLSLYRSVSLCLLLCVYFYDWYVVHSTNIQGLMFFLMH